MLDNEELEEPESLRQHFEISARSNSHQKFLDCVYKKISRK